MDDSHKTPFQYALDLIVSMVPAAKLPAAVSALFPMLQELVQSEEILTDQRRADLSAKVLQALRRLGLEGTDIG